ncbi:MAG: hypothetical protein JWM74_1976, partial [Myxococcaceae bacterium]|nr:hypothetical protein [Myxococcaceae bacterium]
GKGGGSSIAIILVDSPITLRNCTVDASNGGAAGKGTLGSDPTPPGVAGPAYGTDSIGTVGGNGGNGGRSGWSGNGAAGHSIGIATHTGIPTVVNTPDATIGVAGATAPAISDTPSGKTIPAGGAGIATTLHPF